MNHLKRGRCIILNYKQFHSPDLNERKGTDKDANDLLKTFTALNFDVVPYQNRSYSETMKIFYEGNNIYFIVLFSIYLNNFIVNCVESKRDHSDHDCFVVCILSHGTNGSMYFCTLSIVILLYS